MRLAVIQHARRDTTAADSALLLESIANACSRGAAVVVLPHPAWLPSADIESVARAAFIATEYPDASVLAGPFVAPDAVDGAPPARGARIAQTPLGKTAVLSGDECLDPLIAQELAVAAPEAVILRPGSESDLQAEAMLERALALSESASGLVVIAEADGGAPGEPGHGGSAIAILGEVVAEAVGGDDILLVEVAVPISKPDTRSTLPDLPPILAQRWALHHGERMRVDYPADPA